MNMKKLLGIFGSFFLGGIIFIAPVQAEDAEPYRGFDLPFEASDVGLQSFDYQDQKNAGARTDGSSQINNAVLAVVDWARNLLGTLALIWILVHAYALLTGGDSEEDLDKAKHSIIYGITALLLSFLAEPIVRNVIYGGGSNLAAGEAIFNQEVSTFAFLQELQGVIRFIKTFIGIVAVVMIIITGAQSLMSMEEGAEDKQKRNIIWILIGIVIIVLNEVIIQTGIYGAARYNPDTNKVELLRSSFQTITEVSGLLTFAMSFFALGGLTAIIYGGFLVLTASVDEEQASKGKKIIQSVGIGFVIVIISYTLVRTVLLLES